MNQNLPFGLAIFLVTSWLSGNVVCKDDLNKPNTYKYFAEIVSIYYICF